MERVEVEAYSQDTNGWIVRTPGRKFPALVIQGDSLSALFVKARAVLERARDKSNDQELIDDSEELCDLLWSRLRHYEETLRANGIELPYSRVAWQSKR